MARDYTNRKPLITSCCLFNSKELFSIETHQWPFLWRSEAYLDTNYNIRGSLGFAERSLSSHKLYPPSITSQQPLFNQFGQNGTESWWMRIHGNHRGHASKPCLQRPTGDSVSFEWRWGIQWRQLYENQSMTHHLKARYCIIIRSKHPLPPALRHCSVIHVISEWKCLIRCRWYRICGLWRPAWNMFWLSHICTNGEQSCIPSWLLLPPACRM